MSARKFQCSDCRQEWSVSFETGRPETCPQCNSSNFHRSENDMKPSSLFLTAVMTVCLPQAFAQEEEVQTEDAEMEEIVTTGTAVERTEFETPQTVTQFSEEDLRLFTSSSQAGPTGTPDVRQ